MTKVKLIDGSFWEGGSIYAFSNSGIFEPIHVQSDMVRVTNDSDDVVNCDTKGVLWLVLVADKPMCFYTVEPRKSYLCIATTSIDTFNRWCGK